ncbi:MAG TPA: NAD(P)/FAD-dependent oxidoreductase [Xanthobacteraceae bacterium]|nr:NAD(P)/FAD-dependent oxidoreductase [Xanthobacteraceae bacterium]
METSPLDCLIIGGGPAGLTAANYLARFRRNALLVDEGQSRARLIPETHNYPGFLGISGMDLLATLREQAEENGARLQEGRVEELRKADGVFIARVGNTEIRAKRLLLATGIIDESPDLPGLKDAIYRGALRFCPICDAFEAMDMRIGVLGPARSAAGKAQFLRAYSREVVVLPIDEPDKADKEARALAQAGITLEQRVVDVARSGEKIVAVFADGRRLRMDVLYPAMGCEVRSQLALALGARCNDIGNLHVDDQQRTSVEGLYAGGDVVTDLHQISVATGHAAVAATAIHNSLPRNYR